MVSHVHVGPRARASTRSRAAADQEYLCCDRCGRVTTVDPAALDGVRAALQADFGHLARFSHFPIHGLCAECAARREHEHRHGHLVHSHPHGGEHEH